MAKDNRNFIYAYDDEGQQIIIINAETGERVEQKDNHVISILSYLKAQENDVTLRKFALWCAYQANTTIKPLQKKFLNLAQKTIDGKSTPEELKTLYTQSEGEAIATDTVGLRQGSAKAPGFLASRECINPDAYEGAKNAARFHCLWAEMNSKTDTLPDFMEEIGPAASKETIEQTEQKQIDYLLELIAKV